MHGQALALLGKPAEAVPEIKTAVDSFEATGAVVPGWEYASLASAFLAAKQPQEGLRLAAKGLEVADNTSNVELCRLQGELILMGDPGKTAAAEASFRAAIEAARKQSAKFPELRATVSLGRLLVKQDRCSEDRAMLAEIYNWFTEGFDTADLKDAKALLDEFNS